MTVFAIEIPDNVRISVKADLEYLTTYILLELEDWFEDEISFVRRCIEPGMLAFDIGANHGVYTLTMAALMKDAGHVWAFEPSSQPLSLLRRSIHENGFLDRITVLDCALSDRAGTAPMGVSTTQSEGNSLHRLAGETEEVRLDTLDATWQRLGAPAIDFVKLDAEGEEEKILRAGTRFLTECQPLIMFEIQRTSGEQAALAIAFVAMGYGIYRLVPGLGLLAPVDLTAGYDYFQVNLFACKPERAARLAARGLLAREVNDASTLSLPQPDPGTLLGSRPFAAGLANGWLRGAATGNALACVLAAEDEQRSPAERIGLLLRGVTGLEESLKAEDHPATRLSLLRALRAYGRRGEMMKHLQPLLDQGAGTVAAALAERPFLPPLAAWDAAPVRGGVEAWTAALLADTLAISCHHSTYYSLDSVGALWEQRSNPNSTVAMFRRLFLMILRSGRTVRFTDERNDTLLRASAEHRNADIWKWLLDPNRTAGGAATAAG
ncbi:FkbM family methyltransferase [Azospirillum sp. RWY-5-1]|uniref:FkbM family methyltransferase n=1 Tax=Azospirillum oleiclasticum TaxID=2735135 RepID=A0ABX2T9N0_9PROT|nr:FkbM family methyltransferase [Azospirillum oleiclasticum]NYZ12812.1 FkbM family methyltransferase [Azospirillum oleiclasticum]NYZ19972.1 FkbM family methyltransferase [Azospirillum oleiclasticum]